MTALPVPTHDAAAALVGGRVYLFGGGEAVSTDTVLRVDPGWRTVARAGSLGEPLSDLGAATVGGKTYLVGGYTGSRYATAVLRFRPGAQPQLVTRLPVGLRYAGVAALGSKIYVAGGLADVGRDERRLRGRPRRPARCGRSRPCRGRSTTPRSRRSARGSCWLAGARGRCSRSTPLAGASRPVANLPQALTDPAAVAQAGRVLVLGGGTNAVYALG